MATRTWALSKDTSLAGGTLDSGNGNEQHAPIGLWSGVIFRYFAQYAVDTSGMASITAATLHIKSSNQTHAAFGSSPTLNCDRLTTAWTGSGGSEGTWSSSASPKFSTAPSVTSTGETTTNVTKTPNTWVTIDVTDIANAWRTGSPNYGIRLRALNEATTADTWEGYAQASSYDSYITVTYAATVTAHPPTVTQVSPLTGDVAAMSYVAGSGWTAPRPTLKWSFADLDAGQGQGSYEVVVYNDAFGLPGSILYDTGKIADSITSLRIDPVAFTEGSYYHWTVQVWDSTDSPSTVSPYQRFRTRWGAAEYVFDMGAAPLTWNVSQLSTAGNVIIEYNSTTNAADPGAGLGTWMADLAAVVKQRYARYRVWLLPGFVAPSLDKFVLSYNTAALPTLDKWTLSAHATVDGATRVYGVQSLRIDGAGADERTYQLVKVEPNTVYQLTGRIKQSAIAIGAFITLGSTTTGGDLASAPASPTNADWEEVGVEWNSGASTQVYIQCGMTGTGTSWFDALKLEASTVATQWHPALLNAGTVVDASGLRVDASKGGNVRLRGSAGGVGDVVDIGVHGLRLGGVSEIGAGSSFPTSPGTNDTFYRTDLSVDFFYDGSRWLSKDLYHLQMGDVAALTATTAQNGRVAVPVLSGGSDIWLVDHKVVFFVVGGTALDASNKWVGTFDKVDTTNTATTITTDTISSGTLSVWRSSVQGVNASVSPSTYFLLSHSWTKTGTPGNLIQFEYVTFRIVAT